MIAANTNIATALVAAATAAPERPWLHFGEQTLNFAGAARRAAGFAAGLTELGIVDGDRVVVFAPNGIDLVIAELSVIAIGATAVAIGHDATVDELTHVIADTAAVAVVVERSLVDTSLAAVAAGPSECRVLVIGAPDDNGERVVHDSVIETSAWAKSKTELVVRAVANGHPALILYTSGTTGRPRGAVITHKNLRFVADVLVCDFWKLKTDDVLMMVAPGSHIFGQATVFVSLVTQAGLSIIPKFIPSVALKAIADHRVSFIAGVPQIGQFLAGHPHAVAADLSSLRRLMLGGSAMPAGLPDALADRLGVEVITGYGMTEAVPISFTPDDCRGWQHGSTGIVTPGTSVRLVDSEGQSVAHGEAGEIVVRGPHVFAGYLNEPVGDSVSWFGDWFRTGDVGRFGADGALFVVDRLKAMLKTAGYSVFPAEVEQVISAHPAVVDAALFAREHATLGAILEVAVTVAPGADLSGSALISFCKERLAAYKCPRRVHMVDELARNAAGKIMRDEVAETCSAAGA